MTMWHETTTLFAAHGGSGYDWATTQIISRPHGDTVQYAVYTDSGCSCSDERMDNLDSYGLTWSFDFMDARREAEDDIRGNTCDYNEAEKAEYLHELRTITP